MVHTLSISAVLFALVITPQSVFSSPFGSGSQAPFQQVNSRKVEGSYIVKLKEDASKEATIAWLKAHLDPRDKITHDYDASFFNAFAGLFSDSTLSYLAQSQDVEYISEDAILHATGTQTNAPWGLQRISNKGSLPSTSNPNTLSYKYAFSSDAGRGVDVYVLDTGINIGHVTFQGRARFGYSTMGSTEDGNGHGTHCAGTIGGAEYGVAKNAAIIAVKVLNDEGSGPTSGIIAGINWVVSQNKQYRRPSIINMSLTGSSNTALDNACTGAVHSGVHVVVAAGNDNSDASKYSPARASGVITVGALTIQDQRASFSNFGSVVDIFAPGQRVISSWIGSNTATNNLSGTSMSSPHVAGVAAVYLSTYGSLAPSDLTGRLKQHGDRSTGGLLVVQNPSLV